jgi:uncharacterized protein
MKNYQKLYYSNQEDFLAYKFYQAKKDKKCGIIFLGGFKSDMEGTKAQYLAQWAENYDIDYLRFDYFGHGNSSKNLDDYTIGDWLENSLKIFDSLTSKPQIIVGSSMGGWLMLLLALQRKTKIIGLVGLASAPDFTENLIWNELSEQEKLMLEQEDSMYLDQMDCKISKKLIFQAREHIILKNEIDLDNIPVRLIHGTADELVPYSTSIALAEKITSTDTQVLLLKDADHRLSKENELKLMTNFIEEVIIKNQAN